jgi:hypothetical protein
MGAMAAAQGLRAAYPGTALESLAQRKVIEAGGAGSAGTSVKQATWQGASEAGPVIARAQARWVASCF